MQKQLSLFVWAVAAFGMAPVWAATNFGMRGASSVDLTNGPAAREYGYYVDYEKYGTKSSTSNYSAKPKSAIYKSYANQSSQSYSSVRRAETRSETVRTEMRRKYYLANPFFQPTKGKFGSVTDLSYNSASYDFALTPLLGDISDKNASFKMTGFTVKEDLSYGITERLAILGMVQYDSNKYKTDWFLPETPDDKISDSGINMYGLGLQWRFVDDEKHIATLSGYFQRQPDMANTLIGDVKGGFKVGRSTFYGLARLWYLMFDETGYGNITHDNMGKAVYIVYGDQDNALFVEGGLGVFSVFDEDWTLNLEAVFGNYDWHNAASIKGAIGWQPGNSFALNLYGKVSVYDDGDGTDLNFIAVDAGQPGGVWGTAHLTGNTDYTIGVQAILYF